MPPSTFPFRLGDKDKNVELLHSELRQLGYAIPDDELQKNCFGTATQQAVLKFQKTERLETTGIVDEKTAERIKERKERDRREYETSLLPVVRSTAREPEHKEILLGLYGEICNSWRMLTDVRFKLLGLVPTVSAAVLISLLSRTKPDEGLSPLSRITISVFGLLVTVGIWIYDQRNTKLYIDLVRCGHRIEEELGIDTGQFRGRISPTPAWLNHRNATNLIYAVAVLGWVFVPIGIWQGWI